MVIAPPWFGRGMIRPTGGTKWYKNYRLGSSDVQFQSERGGYCLDDSGDYDHDLLRMFPCNNGSGDWQWWH